MLLLKIRNCWLDFPSAAEAHARPLVTPIPARPSFPAPHTGLLLVSCNHTLLLNTCQRAHAKHYSNMCNSTPISISGSTTQCSRAHLERGLPLLEGSRAGRLCGGAQCHIMNMTLAFLSPANTLLSCYSFRQALCPPEHNTCQT